MIETREQLTLERARFTGSNQSENTRSAYARDWRFFTDWCQSMSYSPLPASVEAVVLYITRMLGKHKITSARRYISAINDAHRSAGYPRPAEYELRQLIEGAERLRCEKPRQKRPLTVEQLRSIYSAVEGVTATRNRAIIMLGFASALRRSNLAALNLCDITWVEQGLVVQVWKEKQDQKGRGRQIGIVRGKHVETCPVRALEQWILIRGKEPGPLFTYLADDEKITLTRLYNDKVNRIVKRAMRDLGLEPADYGAHSLRSGMVTAALDAGVGEIALARHTGHRSIGSLVRYYRPDSLFLMNPSGLIGL